MSDTDAVMITGATGLIGSNVCRLLRADGRRVRALVRPGSETEPLAALGVELVEGDITSKADVARAAEGTAAIINSAALLGGAAQDMAASNATNHGGSLHCYDVGAANNQRVIELATTTFLVHDSPLTEHPEVVDDVTRRSLQRLEGRRLPRRDATRCRRSGHPLRDPGRHVRPGSVPAAGDGRDELQPPRQCRDPWSPHRLRELSGAVGSGRGCRPRGDRRR